MVEQKQVALRLEPDFYDQVVALANRDERSIHNQVVFMLKTYLDRDLLLKRLDELDRQRPRN